MADGIKLKMRGMSELQGRILAFKGKPRERIVRAGLKQGAENVKLAASRRVPKRRSGGLKRISSGTNAVATRTPGFLRRMVVYAKRRGMEAYRIGPTFEAFYGNILEIGRRPGMAPSRHAHRGARQVSRMHPRPWLLPTFYREKQRTLKRIVGGMKKSVVREQRRAKREAAKNG